jgi:hypothetical protein
MNLRPEFSELLVRYLDGRTTANEAEQVVHLLRDDAAAREFLMEMAEHSVMIADFCRTAAIGPPLSSERDIALQSRSDGVFVLDRPSVRQIRAWQLGVAVCVVALFGVSAFAYKAISKPSVAKVLKVTGANQYLGASGRSEDAIQIGMGLVAGDMIESRSCDSWITLDLDQGAMLTIAGNSAIRIQYSDSREKRIELVKGSLWYSPTDSPAGQRIAIQTPTLVLEFQDSLLNVQTSASESMVRVHSGTARVTRRQDGLSVDTRTGYQTHVVLGERSVLTSVLQPKPTSLWSSQLMKGSEILLGNWLPPTESHRSRLGAAPLLWPVPNQEPVMLYATAVAAWRCSDRPVMLKADSVFRFRGRTSKPQAVLFGFSVQKMYGVFAGKFELEVPADELGPSGEYWEAILPLSAFKSLHPQLAPTPDTLELTDVYALTILEDAGLEITEIELIDK